MRVPQLHVVVVSNRPILVAGLREWVDQSSGFRLLAAGPLTASHISRLASYDPVLVVDGYSHASIASVAACMQDTHARCVVIADERSTATTFGLCRPMILPSVASRQQLIATLQALASPSGSASVLSADRNLGAVPRLSHRELEVLTCWMRCRSKQEVAAELDLAISTIDTYLARIRLKYTAVGRPAATKALLAARAIHDNLIDPNAH